LAGTTVQAAEVRVLTAGAYKGVLVALVPEFEKSTGHKVVLDNDTAGALQKRISGGEAVDLAVITPRAGGAPAKGGKVAGRPVNPGRGGIGGGVKEGRPVPNVATVDAFKQALLAAKSVAYIDPASGGSSGIYLANLFEKMGIADQVKPKAKLKQGG